MEGTSAFWEHLPKGHPSVKHISCSWWWGEKMLSPLVTMWPSREYQQMNGLALALQLQTPLQGQVKAKEATAI